MEMQLNRSSTCMTSSMSTQQKHQPRLHTHRKLQRYKVRAVCTQVTSCTHTPGYNMPRYNPCGCCQTALLPPTAARQRAESGTLCEMSNTAVPRCTGTAPQVQRATSSSEPAMAVCSHDLARQSAKATRRRQTKCTGYR
jgi:hypothetical protein